MLTNSSKLLFGLDEAAMTAFVDDDGKSLLLEPETLTAFLRMKQAAAKDGVSLNICSAFRNFDHQCRIWNLKATGKRTLLNAQSEKVDITSLSDTELLDTMLIWSALPGTSRHHWGTDVDLFDAKSLPRDALRLLNSEYLPDGPCHQMSLWLEQHAESYSFYRPFKAKESGTTEELWHYSYFPKSSLLLAEYNQAALYELIAASDISLKAQVLAKLPDLVQRYVKTVSPAPTV